MNAPIEARHRCFRGTKQLRDWLTNIQLGSVPIRDLRLEGDVVLGNIHKDFHDAYMSVLGGALAVVAT